MRRSNRLSALLVPSPFGLALREDSAVLVDPRGGASYPGVYAAGDGTAGSMQQALPAAADVTRVVFGLVRDQVFDAFDGNRAA